MPLRHALLAAVLLLAGCAAASDGGISGDGDFSAGTAPGTNTTGMPFILPAGYAIETFAGDLPRARDIVKDGFGNFWVSQPQEGTVTLLEVQDGTVRSANAIFRNLRRPHGLLIDPDSPKVLYIAEEHRVVRAHLYSDAPIETVAELPGVGRHFTRTMVIGEDDRLYVSVGSTCDVCVEEDERHGTVLSMNRDGTDPKIFAQGLRNAVFLALHPATGEIWATEMGRDRLGDDLPPEEIVILKESAHYGWPYCYDNRIRDTAFEPATAFDCAATEPPVATLPAHIAPLGLAFLPDGSLLVAEHGSWNSSVKVGYKIVRLRIRADGTQERPPEDFLTGFLEGGTVHGRPVDILADGDDIYVTDDHAGKVYRLRPSR